MTSPVPDKRRAGRTLSVMPTWRCTAACEHCGTLSSPKNKVYLDEHLVNNAIDQAADAGYGAVCFTGGEATLAWDVLIAGIAHATSRGLPTRLVTNAHWALDRTRAAAKVGELRAAGLKEINYSTGDQHARFVPVERVVMAVDAALEAGLGLAVMVETTRERKITKATLEADQEFAEIVRRRGPVAIHESPWMPLSPFATGDYVSEQRATRQTLPAHGGCDSVLTTTTVQADGTIAACCGIGMRLVPELQLGHIASTSLLEADRKAEDDFLKRWIRAEGPERILAWASEKDPSIEWEGMYAHKCQACLRLYQDATVRRVIREHHREKLADVLFAEWLLFEAVPRTNSAQAT